MKTISLLILLLTAATFASKTDNLLEPVCESNAQILLVKKKGTIQYNHLDSIYAFTDISKILNSNPASSKYMGTRSLLLCLGVTCVIAGLSLQVYNNVITANNDPLNPLALTGGFTLFFGMGCAIGMPHQLNLAIYGYNKNVCRK